MSYWFYFQPEHKIIYFDKLIKQKKKKLLKLGGLNPENYSENDICTICYSEFNKKKKLRRLPVCNHIFHKKCIDYYFVYEKTRCPLCRLFY